MKGLQMMLKSLGISIDPVEVETLWRKLSVAIPQFLTEADAKIKSIDSRLAAIESRQEQLMAKYSSVSKAQNVYCEGLQPPIATVDLMEQENNGLQTNGGRV